MAQGTTFDSIVLGVGAMGSAALYHLARRGQRVLGLERFALGHDRGSSHGRTRVIRKAYFEHPDYVPLLHRAYELWDALAAESGQALFDRTGLLLAGPPGDAVLAGVRRTAAQHGLAIEELSAAERARRFPGLVCAPESEALFERDAGYLRVEACVRAHAALAERHGATLLTGAEVRAIHLDGAGVRVETAAGRFQAGSLVVSAGAYSGALLPELALPLVVRRKVQLWYDAAPALHRDAGFPVFLVSDAALGGIFYGFPALDGADGEGLKVAEHSGGEAVPDPLLVDRGLRADDEVRVRAFLQRHLPGVASARARRHEVCLYTMTPDEHFVLDRHPRHPQLVYAAGFSGHGFKFAAVVGEALADLALRGQTALPIDFLQAQRFAVPLGTSAR